MTEGNNFVTVMVSIELLAQLQHDWSPPVRIQIESTTGGTGYVMNARDHTCPPHDEEGAARPRPNANTPLATTEREAAHAERAT